ncbi:hypothetical protein ACFL6C_10580 [Myxococcota bacterium]
MSHFDDTDVEVHLEVLGEHDEEYDRRVCAVAGCSNPSQVLDDTRRLAPCAVPLCEEHWQLRCESDDVTFGRFTVQPDCCSM